MKQEDVMRFIEQYMQASQFRVAPVTFHTHDNLNSPAIQFKNLVNSQTYAAYQRVTLTPAQVKALHSTPVTLVPAAGSNAFIVVDDVSAYLNYAGTAYTGANNLEFRYTNGSGTKVTADMSSTFLNSSASSYDYSPSITTEFTPSVNKPIVVSVPVANPAAGNSPLTLLVHYRILSLT